MLSKSDTNLKEQVVGILGGMGPEATIDLFSKIVKATGAKKDEDHLRIIIDNNPHMPSRLDAILADGPSPAMDMIETARNLERAGADFIIIGANTAHWFYDEVQAGVNVPVLHIIKETIQWTVNIMPTITKIGILATTGTVKTKMYDKAYEAEGIQVVTPNDRDQDRIMQLIFDFKYGKDVMKIRQQIALIVDSLVTDGVQAVVMGCTEIPLILAGYQSPVLLIDPNQIIAEVAIKRAKGFIS